MPNQGAFEEVYAEYFRFVWRTLRRLGVPECDVADAVQDAFVVVHRKLPTWEGRSKMTTWLFGICLRVASERRRASRSKKETPTDRFRDPPDDRPSAAAELDRRRRLRLLESILGELPLEQRSVFTCFELDGMRGEEIAELLGIPQGTVYSRLRLAREAFRSAAKRVQAREQFVSARSGVQT